MKKKIFIVIIGLLTIITRFVDLENTPGFLTNDEVAIAYNSYSLARTGRDEYGYSWPISFKSFNDYKAPAYIYLLAPLTKILPNNKTTARIPSAIAGSLTVLVTGYLFYELTKNFYLSLIGAGFLSITPWHIALSRMAMETNLALFFLTLGLWLWVKNKQILSAFALSISLFSYHTEKLFVPLFMGIIQWKIWFSKIKFWLIFGLITLLLVWDYYAQLTSGVSLDSKWFWVDATSHSFLTNTSFSMWSKVMMIFRTVISKYGAYLNPGFLFMNGLSLFPDRSFLQSGLFLLPELILIFLGIKNLNNYIQNKYQNLVKWWLLLLPLVPALTIGGPNINRFFIAVVPLSLLAGIGLYWVLTTEKSKFIKTLLIGSIGMSFGFFCMIYFGLYKFESRENFQYGYEQIALKIKNKYYDQYNQIVIDKRFGDYNMYIGAPHLYMYYLNGILPNNNKKIQITEINWNKEKVNPEVLYITPRDNLPPEDRYKTIDEIRLNKGVVEFKLIELVSP